MAKLLSENPPQVVAQFVGREPLLLISMAVAASRRCICYCLNDCFDTAERLGAQCHFVHGSLGKFRAVLNLARSVAPGTITPL